VSCGPDGHGTPTGYQLQAPNKGSHWVRGFTWYHNGVDMAAPAGNTITAAQAGEVIWAGWANDGFGFSVKINHCNHVSTMYGHMEQLLVKVHDVLRAGDPVGLEGSTGWSTGPHLHFMVEWNNVPIDPMPYYNYSQSHIVGLT
jgi:murein DD-endopeptidase MepM/ murein hydrolase activator NlpD